MTLLPSGFRDRLPPHADAAAEVEATVLSVPRSYGYERADPPLVEFADALATRLKAGSLRDAVRFVDPVSQATLAIRPDLTAQIARIAATRMGHHPRPVRLSYAGSVLKLRAPELAPARERRQIGCELIGLDSVAAAQEIVTVAAEALRAAGASGVSIDFTLPDLVDTLAAGALPVAPDQVAVLRDRLDAKDAGGVASIAPAYLPLIEAAGPFAPALDRLRAFDTTGALASRLDGLARIAEALGRTDPQPPFVPSEVEGQGVSTERVLGIGKADARGLDTNGSSVKPSEARNGIQLTLDPTERHGFEYQTWLGFSLFVAGATAEVGRGGTYTIMHEDGAEEPATGFSLYADALTGEGAPARRRLFLPLDTPVAEGERLRAEGWVTVAALEAGDTPEAQLCTHVWAGGEARTR